MYFSFSFKFKGFLDILFSTKPSTPAPIFTLNLSNLNGYLTFNERAVFILLELYPPLDTLFNPTSSNSFSLIFNLLYPEDNPISTLTGNVLEYPITDAISENIINLFFIF